MDEKQLKELIKKEFILEKSNALLQLDLEQTKEKLKQKEIEFEQLKKSYQQLVQFLIDSEIQNEFKIPPGLINFEKDYDWNHSIKKKDLLSSQKKIQDDNEILNSNNFQIQEFNCIKEIKQKFRKKDEVQIEEFQQIDKNKYFEEISNKDDDKEKNQIINKEILIENKIISNQQNFQFNEIQENNVDDYNSINNSYQKNQLNKNIQEQNLNLNYNLNLKKQNESKNQLINKNDNKNDNKYDNKYDNKNDNKNIDLNKTNTLQIDNTQDEFTSLENNIQKRISNKIIENNQINTSNIDTPKFQEKQMNQLQHLNKQQNIYQQEYNQENDFNFNLINKFKDKIYNQEKQTQEVIQNTFKVISFQNIDNYNTEINLSPYQNSIEQQLIQSNQNQFKISDFEQKQTLEQRKQLNDTQLIKIENQKKIQVTPKKTNQQETINDKQIKFFNIEEHNNNNNDFDQNSQHNILTPKYIKQNNEILQQKQLNKQTSENMIKEQQFKEDLQKEEINNNRIQDTVSITRRDSFYDSNLKAILSSNSKSFSNQKNYLKTQSDNQIEVPGKKRKKNVFLLYNKDDQQLHSQQEQKKEKEIFLMKKQSEGNIPMNKNIIEGSQLDQLSMNGQEEQFFNLKMNNLFLKQTAGFDGESDHLLVPKMTLEKKSNFKENQFDQNNKEKKKKNKSFINKNKNNKNKCYQISTPKINKSKDEIKVIKAEVIEYEKQPIKKYLTKFKPQKYSNIKINKPKKQNDLKKLKNTKSIDEFQQLIENQIKKLETHIIKQLIIIINQLKNLSKIINKISIKDLQFGKLNFLQPFRIF